MSFKEELFPMKKHELVPVKLQNLLRTKCAEFPGIKTAWLCPAVMDGMEVYFLTVIADGEADLGPLLEEAFKISDRPFNGVIQQNADDMGKFMPLYVRDHQGE